MNVLRYLAVMLLGLGLGARNCLGTEPAASANAELQKGSALLDQGAYEQVIECFSEVIRQQPENATAYYKRGYAEYALSYLVKSVPNNGKTNRGAASDWCKFHQEKERLPIVGSFLERKWQIVCNEPPSEDEILEAFKKSKGGAYLEKTSRLRK